LGGNPSADFRRVFVPVYTGTNIIRKEIPFESADIRRDEGTEVTIALTSIAHILC
jgi:hypothetical protein